MKNILFHELRANKRSFIATLSIVQSRSIDLATEILPAVRLGAAGAECKHTFK